MTKITNGLVLAGFDTIISSFKKIVSDQFKNSDKFLNNKIINEMRPGLISFGTGMIKKSLISNGDKLYESNFKIIDDSYKYCNKNPFWIDSGGFIFSIGKVEQSYVSNLIEYYTKYIQETCLNPEYNNMLYFYLDIVPTAGITKDFSLKHMKIFHDMLLDKIKDIPGAKEKMYIVIQVNNPIAYDTFYHFIRDNSIHEQLNSHKWSIGGIVPLQNNNPQYIVRPYMPAIFDCLDLELNSLKNNIPVYFHILGTSSYYEMFLVAWMNILCEYYNIPFIITFDSTACINNATRTGIIHYIDENNDNNVIKLDSKHANINTRVDNNYTNYDYLNKIKNFLFNNIDIIEDFDWFEKGRWSKIGSNALILYEAWAFGKVFDYIKNECYKKKDWIIYNKNRYNLKSLVVNIMQKIDNGFNSSVSRKTFDSHIMGRLIKSLEWFESALKNKLPDENKSYYLINKMFNTNTHLMTNGIQKIENIDDFI